MTPDRVELYRQMLRSRLLEEAVGRLWTEGRISAEMHPGLGEEGIVAGVVAHLEDGDAMALDHRGTPPLVMRGTDPELLVRELLGDPGGLCSGQGGHMHLFDRERLAASSGIVGAAGPLACGFALAAEHLRPGKIALAFFGEGAMNQGMLLESMNLAAAWSLPVIFVCKDNGWSIATESARVTGGDLDRRAEGLGVPPVAVDGSDAEAVWRAVAEPVARAREGGGPTFLHATCEHPEGHFLGFKLLRIARRPVHEMKDMAGPMIRSTLAPRGAPVTDRAAALSHIAGMIGQTVGGRMRPGRDPVKRLRRRLAAQPLVLSEIEEDAASEIDAAVEAATAGITPGAGASA